MQDLPSAILGDQRELARLPEASVSNPTQPFSLFADAVIAAKEIALKRYVVKMSADWVFYPQLFDLIGRL